MAIELRAGGLAHTGRADCEPKLVEKNVSRFFEDLKALIG